MDRRRFFGHLAGASAVAAVAAPSLLAQPEEISGIAIARASISPSRIPFADFARTAYIAFEKRLNVKGVFEPVSTAGVVDVGAPPGKGIINFYNHRLEAVRFRAYCVGLRIPWTAHIYRESLAEFLADLPLAVELVADRINEQAAEGCKGLVMLIPEVPGGLLYGGVAVNDKHGLALRMLADYNHHADDIVVRWDIYHGWLQEPPGFFAISSSALYFADGIAYQSRHAQA